MLWARFLPNKINNFHIYAYSSKRLLVLLFPRMKTVRISIFLHLLVQVTAHWIRGKLQSTNDIYERVQMERQDQVQVSLNFA